MDDLSGRPYYRHSSCRPARRGRSGIVHCTGGVMKRYLRHGISPSPAFGSSQSGTESRRRIVLLTCELSTIRWWSRDTSKRMILLNGDVSLYQRNRPSVATKLLQPDEWPRILIGARLNGMILSKELQSALGCVHSISYSKKLRILP